MNTGDIPVRSRTRWLRLSGWRFIEPGGVLPRQSVSGGGALTARRRGKDDVASIVTRRRLASHALAVKLHWALRIGVALEFLGHGLAGFYRPVAWVPYFTFFGIPETFAYDHMTYITGTLDIALGVLVLIRPMRAVMLHMAAWGLLTACLRPLTGESWLELVERGANYGMPLALLVLSGWGGRSLRSWFERVGPPEEIDEALARRLGWIMRASIALLLVGHGGLGIWAAKAEWLDFMAWFGVTNASQAGDLTRWVGVFEAVLGLAVLVKPLRQLLLFVLAWKVGTELLRPLVGQPNYQFVERAGDYALPLALFWLTRKAVPGFPTDRAHGRLGSGKESGFRRRTLDQGPPAFADDRTLVHLGDARSGPADEDDAASVGLVGTAKAVHRNGSPSAFT